MKQFLISYEISSYSVVNSPIIYSLVTASSYEEACKKVRELYSGRGQHVTDLENCNID